MKKNVDNGILIPTYSYDLDLEIDPDFELLSKYCCSSLLLLILILFSKVLSNITSLLIIFYLGLGITNYPLLINLCVYI